MPITLTMRCLIPSHLVTSEKLQKILEEQTLGQIAAPEDIVIGSERRSKLPAA